MFWNINLNIWIHIRTNSIILFILHKIQILDSFSNRLKYLVHFALKIRMLGSFCIKDSIPWYVLKYSSEYLNLNSAWENIWIRCERIFEFVVRDYLNSPWVNIWIHRKRIFEFTAREYLKSLWERIWIRRKIVAKWVKLWRHSNLHFWH